MQKKAIKMELALIDEVKTRITEVKQKITSVKQSEKALLDLFDTASKLASQLQTEFSSGTSVSNVVTKSVDRTKQVASQLGVNASNLPEIKQVLELQQQLEKALMSAEQTLKAYRSL